MVGNTNLNNVLATYANIIGNANINGILNVVGNTNLSNLLATYANINGNLSLFEHVTGTASGPPDSDEESDGDYTGTVSSVAVIPQQLINILSNMEKSKDSERRTHLRAIGYDEAELQAMASDE